MNDQKEWENMIERIKRTGAGTYGTTHFMCRKHEHWKFLWADERIKELEAENERIDKENNHLRDCAVTWQAQVAELRQAAQATFTTLNELLRDPNTYRLEGEFGDAMWEELWSHRDALALLDKVE